MVAGLRPSGTCVLLAATRVAEEDEDEDEDEDEESGENVESGAWALATTKSSGCTATGSLTSQPERKDRSISSNALRPSMTACSGSSKPFRKSTPPKRTDGITPRSQ